MMKKWTGLGLLILGMCCLLANTAQAGGWAVLSLESWPENVIADKPFQVHYALRQHGNNLISNVEGAVTAVSMESGESLMFEATGTGEPGRYSVEMQLPTPGEWRWQIDAFGSFDMPLLTVQPATAVSASTPPQLPGSTAFFTWLVGLSGALTMAVAVVLWFRRRIRFAPVFVLMGMALCLAGFVISPADKPAESADPPTSKVSIEQGQVLFVAKGCVTCHHHEAVNEVSNYIGIGPDLTHHPLDQGFLRQWLHDPKQIRPETLMPNLELTDGEIDALIAFLSQDAVAEGKP